MKPSELLSDETKWTKGYLARNMDGDGVGVLHPHAICWCMEGALLRCYVAGGGEHLAQTKKLRAHLGQSIVNFNDAPKRTFAEVRAAFLACDL